MILDFAEQLEAQIKVEASKLLELEDLADKTRFEQDEQEEVVYRLKQALNAIQGTLDLRETTKDTKSSQPSLESLESQSRLIPAPPSSPQRPSEPVDTRIHCNACGGRMESSLRTLQSGKTYTILVCTDSGCNNEQF